jgi:transcriptional regulator with XRE-family HTH domain
MDRGPRWAFGRLLRRYIEERGLTHAQMAEEMAAHSYHGGSSRRMISRIIRTPTRLSGDFFRCAALALYLTDDEEWRLYRAYAHEEE